MQDRFESNFTHKLYKKKLEELRKFHRSIAKFKKLIKMKNNDVDNLSDKRFRDIVEAYKRHHVSERKINNFNTVNPLNRKKAKSQSLDDFSLDEKNRICAKGNENSKRPQFLKDDNIQNLKIYKFNAMKKYNIQSKNNIRVLDFSPHPSRFVNNK